MGLNGMGQRIDLLMYVTMKGNRSPKQENEKKVSHNPIKPNYSKKRKRYTRATTITGPGLNKKDPPEGRSFLPAMLIKGFYPLQASFKARSSSMELTVTCVPSRSVTVNGNA